MLLQVGFCLFQFVVVIFYFNQVFPKIDYSDSSSRIVLKQNKFGKKGLNLLPSDCGAHFLVLTVNASIFVCASIDF